MKQWRRSDEWQTFAGCGGDPRFLTPPEKLSGDDVEDLQKICWRCPVRPECIKHAVAHEETGVWCASRFLPEPFIDDSKSQAYGKLDESARIRDELASTVDDELKRRGDF